MLLEEYYLQIKSLGGCNRDIASAVEELTGEVSNVLPINAFTEDVSTIGFEKLLEVIEKSLYDGTLFLPVEQTLVKIDNLLNLLPKVEQSLDKFKQTKEINGVEVTIDLVNLDLKEFARSLETVDGDLLYRQLEEFGRIPIVGIETPEKISLKYINDNSTYIDLQCNKYKKKLKEDYGMLPFEERYFIQAVHHPAIETLDRILTN